MFLNTNTILKELSYIASKDTDIVELLEEFNDFLNATVLDEAQYDKVVDHLKLEVLDVEKFVQRNELQPVTNPRAFVRDNIPSDDGLLSNKIFGITRDDRAGIFAYINLNGDFIDPSCYKTWSSMDSRIKTIVHGTKTYKISETGDLIEDPNGKTGIGWLKKNINKIKFKSSESIRRDIKVQYMEMNRNNMFISKYIVIPPFYRDKNTGSSNSRTVGLGGINKLYTNLIVAVNALLATQDYMFDASEAMRGRVQEIILAIYDWFCGNNNKNINTDLGTGLSGKFGVLQRANMSKTANFSSRLVISAPELKVEKPENMMSSFDKSAIPLAAAIAEFRDFVMFHTRKFFDNEFTGIETYPIIDKNGKLKYVTPEDPAIVLSDERIRKEMERFLHGYNNRFVPVEIPIEGTKEKFYMQFKGRGTVGKSTNPESIYNRRLTWCDVFFIACSEAIKDKHVLVTRFPIDSFANQITTKIELSSTKETEPMHFDDIFYPYYPKIREKDIGTDTSNRFVDTFKMSNLYLPGMKGDYDGDQITCKGVYTTEANEELEEFMNSKENFLDFGCKALRTSTADVIQSIYALTKHVSDVTPTDAIKFA